MNVIEEICKAVLGNEIGEMTANEFATHLQKLRDKTRKPKYEIIVEGVDYLWDLFEYENEPDQGDEDGWMWFDGARALYHFIRERCGYQSSGETAK